MHARQSTRSLAVLIFAALLISVASTSQAALLKSAGEVIVDLRTNYAPANAGGTTWQNFGSLGNFTEVGNPVISGTLTGTNGISGRGVTFNGTTDAYVSNNNAPAGITGAGDRTVEVWAYNTAIPVEETIVSWARRGSNGQNVSMNWGSSAAFGAVGHWGGDDIGWGGGGAPDINNWHHLVYTQDGTTTRVYIDGVETNSETPITLNSFGGYPVNIAAQRDVAGTGLELFGSLTISNLRIYDGVLDASDVLFNFNQGMNAVLFAIPEPNTALLVGIGMAALAMRRRRRRREATAVCGDLIG